MEVRQPKMIDITWVAANLRESDREELKASSGQDPLDSILNSIDKSRECYALIGKDDMCCAIMGVGPSSCDGCHIAWLLGTDDINTERKSFVKITKSIADRWVEQHGAIGNAVDARAIKSHKWLESIGFEHILTWASFGKLGLPFHLYVRYKKDEEK